MYFAVGWSEAFYTWWDCRLYDQILSLKNCEEKAKITEWNENTLDGLLPSAGATLRICWHSLSSKKSVWRQQSGRNTNESNKSCLLFSRIGNHQLRHR